MNEKEHDKTMNFNFYYLNLSKVYEIAMMINNVIVSSVQHENSNLREKFSSLKFFISGGMSSKRYLAEIKSVIGSETSEKMHILLR